MQKKSPAINLVKKRVNLFDEFIKWALSIGRLVVILTELVALLTFLFRFSLDRQLIDLNDKIKSEETIISYEKDQEATYRNLQDRLALASNVTKQSEDEVKVFNDIESNIPSDMSISTFSLFEQGVRVQASVKSISSVSKFINFLKKYPNIDGVSIDKIENKASSGVILITISATFKGGNN